MSIRITIAQSAEQIPYKDKKDGSDQFLRKQTAYAHLVDVENVAALYPEKFQFLLDRKQPMFVPGDYTLHPSGFYVKSTQFGPELMFLPNRLTPIKAKTTN